MLTDAGLFTPRGLVSQNRAGHRWLDTHLAECARASSSSGERRAAGAASAGAPAAAPRRGWNCCAPASRGGPTGGEGGQPSGHALSRPAAAAAAVHWHEQRDARGLGCLPPPSPHLTISMEYSCSSSCGTSGMMCSGVTRAVSITATRRAPGGRGRPEQQGWAGQLPSPVGTASRPSAQPAHAA